MPTSSTSLAEVLQATENSEATYHDRRNQHGGTKRDDTKRLKELKNENSRQKRLLAEAELNKALPKLLRGNE